VSTGPSHLTPTAFAVGLWTTRAEAQAVEDANGLAANSMAVILVYAAGLPDDLADRLVALGVAGNVVHGFDGSALACQRLATGLSNVGHGVGRAESDAEAAKAQSAMAGRVCTWCSRTATASGYAAGGPRLACDHHADQLDVDSDDGGGGR
jgi:hypothetical protein